MKGKHASTKVIFFAPKNGKHSKNELIVYNPLYARFSACLSSLAVATSFLVCLTFGKFKGTLASTDAARAARYILDLSSQQTSITEFVPNTVKSTTFEIRNFKGDLENPAQVNEVKLRYKIKIEAPSVANLPLNYKLYNIDDEANPVEIVLNNNASNYIEVSSKAQIHKYRLDIIWQNGLDEVIYANLTDEINIAVDAEQID